MHYHTYNIYMCEGRRIITNFSVHDFERAFLKVCTAHSRQSEYTNHEANSNLNVEGIKGIAKELYHAVLNEIKEKDSEVSKDSRKLKRATTIPTTIQMTDLEKRIWFRRFYQEFIRNRVKRKEKEEKENAISSQSTVKSSRYITDISLKKEYPATIPLVPKFASNKSNISV